MYLGNTTTKRVSLGVALTITIFIGLLCIASKSKSKKRVVKRPAKNYKSLMNEIERIKEMLNEASKSTNGNPVDRK